MKVTTCRFVCSAYRPEDEPRDPGPDVLLLGRSNVGKSSLLNRLVGIAGLARTSAEPGRTRSVNFYRVDERWNLVDLPGYGWARVPATLRRSWRPLVEGTLERRRARIALALLVVDARHEPSALDRTMRDWLDSVGLDFLVLGTKADKLSGNARAVAARRLLASLGRSPRAEPILVSAHSGMGIATVWRQLERALADASARR